jgi:predicted nuclease of predicted toxin-antitoxin system
MSPLRFLVDNDVNVHIIEGVTRLEPAVHFEHVRDIGLHEATDEEILAYASAHALIVVSHDVHTMSAAAISRIVSGKPMAGLILIPQRSPVRLTIEHLILHWSATTPAEWYHSTRYLPFK